MLSDYERRELGLIEDGLADDHRLVDVLGGDRRVRHGRWQVRALIGFGSLLLTIGIVTGAGMLVLQGLLIAGLGIAWFRWRARPGAAGSPGSDRERSSPRPFGPPPD
jgi:hypothetical protein